MSRKHFIMIANLVHEMTKGMDERDRQAFAEHAASEVKRVASNSEFNRQRFINACLEGVKTR